MGKVLIERMACRPLRESVSGQTKLQDESASGAVVQLQLLVRSDTAARREGSAAGPRVFRWRRQPHLLALRALVRLSDAAGGGFVPRLRDPHGVAAQ